MASTPPRVPVVSIGASAGGVAALQTFFEALPVPVGAAFVVVVHLDPHRASELTRILAARTSMPVIEVTTDQPIEPDKVYVIPPARKLLATSEFVTSTPFDEPRGLRSPIDNFFRSIAEQHGDGIAIVLTGAGFDGTVGVKAVKEGGGLVLVQDPNEAEYPSMPRSAIASGVADLVLPVREIAARIPELIAKKLRLRAEDLAERDEQALSRVLAYLKVKSGHDFSHYKRATILRRVGRRMQVTGTETLDEYLVYLRSNAEEAQSLLGDLLISVTSFFRDTDAFNVLSRAVIPELFAQEDEQYGIRVWVPGCATGEEVYSIAMLLLEEAAHHEHRPEIQLFASDLDATALATAREGSYHLTIQSDVSEERLRRFFTREGDHYRIKREVRDLVVFAQHSLLKDPPFSHIDLISCRNLLIYLDRELQNQVCATFHYALRPNGYLFVGSSETIERQSFFKTINRDARIFQAIERPRELPPLPRMMTSPRLAVPTPAVGFGREPKGNYSGDHRLALEDASPPSILVDESHRIVHLSESAGRFLLQPGGPLSTAAVDLVRPELKLDLQSGLHRAFEQGQSTLSLPVAVRFNGSPVHVSLHVRPLKKDGDSPAALVWFLEAGAVKLDNDNLSSPHPDDTSQLVTQLRNELAATQAHLRASREQYETVTEELRASNEELQSINEEYRSTAEELETSKEELQSINEELQTLNSELKLKLDAVSRAHNDLQNLMSSTDVATLFLNTDLRIHRFTPKLTDIFNVASGDEGRPISDFTHRLDYEDLTSDAKRVLADLTPRERTVAAEGGRWFMMRLRPYRTLDDKIEGVVATFMDVTDRREAELRWDEWQRLYLKELSGRVAAVLGIVEAVVVRSLDGMGASAAESLIRSRLRSILLTNEVLADHEPGADLSMVVQRQFQDGNILDRLQMEGPRVHLTSEEAVPLGLVVHELVTLAAHSGLSEAGSIKVSWEIIQGDRGRRLKFVWTEPNAANEVSDFDDRLIRQCLPFAKFRIEHSPNAKAHILEMTVSDPRPPAP